MQSDSYFDCLDNTGRVVRREIWVVEESYGI